MSATKSAEVAEPWSTWVRLGLSAAIVVDLLAEAAGVLSAGGLQLFVPTYLEKLYETAGLLILLACLAAFLCAVTGMVQTESFFRSNSYEDAEQAGVWTILGVLLPVMIVGIMYVVLPS